MFKVLSRLACVMLTTVMVFGYANADLPTAESEAASANEGTVVVNVVNQDGVDVAGNWLLRKKTSTGSVPRNGTMGEVFTITPYTYFLEARQAFNYPFFLLESDTPQELVNGGTITFDLRYFKKIEQKTAYLEGITPEPIVVEPVVEPVILETTTPEAVVIEPVILETTTPEPVVVAPTTLEEPDSVSGLSAKAVNNSAVSLKWNDASDAEGNVVDHYRVYYGTESMIVTDYPNYVDTVDNDSKYVVKALAPGTKYYFAVTAVDDNDTESMIYSLEVSTSTKNVPATSVSTLATVATVLPIQLAQTGPQGLLLLLPALFGAGMISRRKRN